MRYYRKKAIREKFQLLKETHQYIKVQMCQNQDIVPILADCQTLAIEIGEEIEKCQGAGSKTVALLEKYCEALYHIAERKYPGLPEKMAEGTQRELEEALLPADKSFEKDIPQERIVVFFPYKASMWDSMESVWKSLREEENTKCVVAPLPFYVKNGKERAERCYEGREFPEKAEVVSYEDILQDDFYADIAIYHNPYDDANKLTQVDERFFSSQLHRYADTLVYMPYYVLASKPEVSFILLPGVKNADYVVLQDEKTAEAFRYWYPGEPKKFIVAESPKITKAKEMAALSREELNIPEEWKSKIRGKKVLFYNTHLANLMKDSLDYIGKLKSVFDTMREQEHVILWWRPHPLTEAARFQISREIYQEYEELIDWYKEAGFGIYDDTPNLHEAIAAADGYYGDTSSVTKLFEAVGKPVMIQREADCVGQDIVFENGCPSFGGLWCSCALFNGLFSVDREKREAQYVAEIPGEKPVGERLYSKIYTWDNRLILLPFKAKQLAVFYVEKQKFEKYTVSPEGENGFYTAEIRRDKMLLIPNYTEDFYLLDLNSFHVERLGGLTEAVGRKKASSGIAMQSCQIGEDDNKVYFVLQETRHLCAYNMEDGAYRFTELPEGMVYAEIQPVGKTLWIMALNKPCLVSYNTEYQKLKTWLFEEYEEEWGAKLQYGHFRREEDRLIFESLITDNRLVFDLTEKKWQKSAIEKSEIIGKKVGTLLETQGSDNGLDRLTGQDKAVEAVKRNREQGGLFRENYALSLTVYLQTL